MLTCLPGWPISAADPNASLTLQRLVAAAAVTCAMMLSAPAARATAITDARGDFLEDTFKGPHNADLDVRSAEATYDHNVIRLRATMDGNSERPATASMSGASIAAAPRISSRTSRTRWVSA